MKVLETRRSGHLTMRRIRKDNGRIVKSMEIPWSLWLPVRTVVMKRLPGFTKTEAARDRIVEVKRLLAEGHKQEYVAAVVGLTQVRVSAIARQKGKP